MPKKPGRKTAPTKLSIFKQQLYRAIKVNKNGESYKHILTGFADSIGNSDIEYEK